MPVHGLEGHSYVPLGLAAHFYLPVVPAWVEALGSQNVNTLEETPVDAHVLNHVVTFQGHSFVPGDVNARMSCVDIEG